MAKTKRTRRSISVRGKTYQRLESHCKAEGLSVSGWLEDIIEQEMDAAGVPIPTVVRVSKPRGPSRAERERAQHFTF